MKNVIWQLSSISNRHNNFWALCWFVSKVASEICVQRCVPELELWKLCICQKRSRLEVVSSMPARNARASQEIDNGNVSYCNMNV